MGIVRCLVLPKEASGTGSEAAGTSLGARAQESTRLARCRVPSMLTRPRRRALFEHVRAPGTGEAILICTQGVVRACESAGDREDELLVTSLPFRASGAIGPGARGGEITSMVSVPWGGRQIPADGARAAPNRARPRTPFPACYSARPTGTERDRAILIPLSGSWGWMRNYWRPT